MRARVSSAGLTGRMLRRRPGSGIVVAVLAIVMAACVATVPAVLQLLNDRVVQEAVASLSPGERDLQATAAGFPEVGPGDADLPESVAAVWGGFDHRLEEVRADLDPPLAPLIEPAQYVSRTTAVGLAGRDGQDSVSIATDPRFADHAVLTAGRWPAAAQPEFADFGLSFAAPVEIVLSTDTADELEWGIGDVRTAAFATAGASVPLQLVGTFDAAPGSDDYWYHAPSILLPKIVYSDLVAYPTAVAVVAPESLTWTSAFGGTTDVWYPFDPAGMSARDAETVAAQLRAFTANGVAVGQDPSAYGTVQTLPFDTDAIPTLEQALDTQAAMASVFAITAAGPAGAAVAVLAVACRVISRNRRPALALLAARGASTRRLRGIQAWHGFWYGTVPALVAGVAAVAAIVALAGSVPPATIVGVLAVAALPPAILGFLAPPGPRLQEEVPEEPGRARRRRRLVLELVVVVIAALALAALVSGAVGGARLGSSGTIDTASVLVVLFPLLAALVGCVVALRLYPLPLRAVLARARRSPRLTGFLGAARALRESAVGVAPVLALVIGVSSAAMSGVLLGSIQHQIDASARAAVGADLQIGRADLTPEVLAKLESVPGVEAVAPIGSVTRVTIRAGGGDHVTATVLVVDPARLAAVQDPDYPLVPDGADLGASGAVPVVLAQLTSSQLDGATDVTLANQQAVVTGVSPLSALQGITEVWAVVDSSRIADVTREAPATRNALVALARGADPAAVSAAVRTVVGDGATVLTADTMRSELSQRTGTAAIRIALIVATGAAALFAALAVMLSLVLSAPARDRLFGLLRALGAPARVGRGLAWWELWPPLAASIVVGLAVGLAVPALLLATVDFGVFIDSAPGYTIDPLVLGVAVLGFLAITAVFTVVALALSRRVRATSVLRQTQEG